MMNKIKENKEVNSFLIGSSGIKLGLEYWNQMLEMYSKPIVDSNESIITLEDLNVYLEETKRGLFIPKTFIIDYNDIIHYEIMQTSFGKYLNQKNLLFLNSNMNYEENKEGYIENKARQTISDFVRTILERSNSCQAFLAINSVGEMAGSSLGKLIHELLSSFAASTNKLNFPVFSTSDKWKIDKEALLELYSCTWLQNFSNLIVPFETVIKPNQIINNEVILSKQFKSESEIIAQIILNITSSLCRKNTSIQNSSELISALVHNQDLKFVTTWAFPISSDQKERNSEIMVALKCFNKPMLSGVNIN